MQWPATHTENFCEPFLVFSVFESPPVLIFRSLINSTRGQISDVHLFPGKSEKDSESEKEFLWVPYSSEEKCQYPEGRQDTIYSGFKQGRKWMLYFAFELVLLKSSCSHLFYVPLHDLYFLWIKFQHFQLKILGSFFHNMCRDEWRINKKQWEWKPGILIQYQFPLCQITFLISSLSKNKPQ